MKHNSKEGVNFDLTEFPKNVVIIESAIFDKKNETQAYRVV